MDDGQVKLIHGHVLDALKMIPDESIQATICSPPYWSLRAYGTEPQVWGGDPGHSHTWTETARLRQSGGNGTASAKQVSNNGSQLAKVVGMVGDCPCGAWRGELGHEPTPQMFVSHLVEVFREIKRVLKTDGTCWVNLGDSYAGSGKGPTGHNGIGDQEQRQGFTGNPDRFKTSTLGGGQSTNLAQNGKQPSAPGIRAKSLVLIPERFALAMQDDGWIVRSRIAWCLSGGTMLYARTQKGDMPQTVKDLARLDPSKFQLWNGAKWTRVKAMWTNDTPSDPIELELRSGETIGCTPEHRWPTQRGLLTASELRVGDVLQSTRLPEPSLPRSPRALDDESVGWFVGLYLAEGNIDTKSIHIACHAREGARYERCVEIARAFDGTATWRPTTNNGATITVYGRILRAICQEYISGHGSKNKHLSNACWRRSNVFLRGLLDGYLHGDGHWDESAGRWRLGFSRNYALAADLRTLSARLGVHIRLRPRFATANGKRFPTFRGELRFQKNGTAYDKHDTEIVRIGKSRGRKFWDIEVEDEPHTFALASGVLTHNCKRAPMPESVRDRPTNAWEHIWMFTKSARYFWDQEAVREPAAAPPVTEKRSGIRSSNLETLGLTRGTSNPSVSNPNGKNQWNYWLLSPDPEPLAHFATFPREIPRRCIAAATREGDTVLDPFVGSGTTTMVARSMLRRSIGIDLNETYLSDIALRKNAQMALMP